MTYDNSMFAEIKTALKERKMNNNGFKDILKFEPKKDGSENVYVVRLLPNTKDLKNTFFNYISYDWNSLSTGKWIKVVSPVTFHERCPIQETKNAAFNNKLSTEEDKNKARILKRKEKCLINVYVIDDPVDPSNNGSVKIIDVGKQIMNKINKALDDNDPDCLGDEIFLKPNSSVGYNLKIVVKKDAAYPTYNESEFTRKPVAIAGVDDKEKIASIYDSTFDLKTVYPIKSYEEIQQILNEHYFTTSTNANKQEKSSSKILETSEGVDLANDEFKDFEIEDNNVIKDVEPSQVDNDVSDIDGLDDDFINSILNK